MRHGSPEGGKRDQVTREPGEKLSNNCLLHEVPTKREFSEFHFISDLVVSGKRVVALFLQVHPYGSLEVAVCKHRSQRLWIAS